MKNILNSIFFSTAIYFFLFTLAISQATAEIDKAAKGIEAIGGTLIGVEGEYGALNSDFQSLYVGCLKKNSENKCIEFTFISQKFYRNSSKIDMDDQDVEEFYKKYISYANGDSRVRKNSRYDSSFMDFYESTTPALFPGPLIIIPTVLYFPSLFVSFILETLIWIPLVAVYNSLEDDDYAVKELEEIHKFLFSKGNIGETKKVQERIIYALLKAYRPHQHEKHPNN